jgi:rSAM/selenodomain-associated transferase 2
MPERISIIIPVFRETGMIHRTLSDLGRPAEAEIIVADGDLQGETLCVIQRRDIIRVISRKGRGVQMNAGSRQATGEILLFLHADTRLPPKGLNRIRAALTDPAVVGGAFDLGIDSQRPVFRLLERTASVRSRLTRIPYGDQAIFIRRNFFREIGGFREIPIMEDVDLMRRIKRTGRPIVFLDARVRTSARRWETEGIIRGTLRNWFLVLLFLAGAAPGRLARYYR